MISADYSDDDIKRPDDPAPEGPDAELMRLQKVWSERIEAEERDNRPFEEEAKRSIKWLRLDEQSRRKKATGNELNIAFANYEVLRSTVYSRPPRVVIQPRFGGGDGEQRHALVAVSEVMERAAESENERAHLHGCLKDIRDEFLKVGRGVGWVRYEADFADQPMDGMPDGQTVQVKIGERIAYDVVPWRDFLHGKAERWRDVPWVARRAKLTREKFKRQFPAIDADRMREIGVSFDGGDAKGDPKNVAGQFATVYEIWCKESRKVYFLAKDAKLLIEEPSDPLIDVQGFYPCPEPAMSVTRDGTLTPVPDVMMIEDQLVAIDDLTKRIRALEKALKVRGFYPKGATDGTAASAVEEAIQLEDERQVLIPVSAWAANGQSKLDVVWLPIDIVVQAIEALKAQRREAVDLVYQVSGISDVMRGDSEASETLGAQQIKDRWGSVRVRDKQEEMRRMARDMIAIATEVICELFEPETIQRAAVYGFDDQMMQVLRDDRMRSFAIDVETDSTVQADEQEDKAQRAEFTQAIGGLLQQAIPLVQQVPEAADLAGELLKFNVQAFRAGRSLEKAIDGFIEGVKARIAQQQAQPPQPDPAIVKAETDAKVRMRGQDIDAELRMREQDMRAGEQAMQSASQPVTLS
jgi:hypothetical protein